MRVCFQGFEHEIVEEWRHLPDRFPDSSVVRGAPLLQAIEECGEIAAIPTQFATVLDVAVQPCWSGLRCVMEVKCPYALAEMALSSLKRETRFDLPAPVAPIGM
jgi:hypothetical protein